MNLKSKVIELCLVMSCFLLIILLNFVQSLEEQRMAVNYRTLSMKEKLELKDSQVLAIKNINLKYFNAISQISKSDYTDRTTYEKAIGQLKQVYQHDIFQTLTHQQRKNWQSIIEEDCLHIK